MEIYCRKTENNIKYYGRKEGMMDSLTVESMFCTDKDYEDTVFGKPQPVNNFNEIFEVAEEIKETEEKAGNKVSLEFQEKHGIEDELYVYIRVIFPQTIKNVDIENENDIVRAEGKQYVFLGTNNEYIIEDMSIIYERYRKKIRNRK